MQILEITGFGENFIKWTEGPNPIQKLFAFDTQ